MLLIPMFSATPNPELNRLRDHRHHRHDWKRWGPYISERAWGTVREDYSPNGDAWRYFTHDHARSKAFRWGEDAIAGWCDDQQGLCFGLALWNGRDPILKERLFGLCGPEGNHGEDVKELYYYLDGTPTHSYMKFLYKYPQNAFPYDALVYENHVRGTDRPEYELPDTGIFGESRYFDVVIEYAKPTPESLVIRITAHNRGPEAATVHLIPQLWFRNTWSWGLGTSAEPSIKLGAVHPAQVELEARHETLGSRHLYAQGSPNALFTDNETNRQRLENAPNSRRYVKDAFHEYFIDNRADAVNPQNRGTKAALDYLLTIPSGQSAEIRLHLTDGPSARPFANFEQTFAQRIAEADAFYASVQAPKLSDDERRIQRQALAGMLWSKQFYYYDMRLWLFGDNPVCRPPEPRLTGRNHHWASLYVADVMSMPDKWEYPWFAAWDLAFHVIPLAMIDIDFAKDQMELLISEKLMHPNGQIPAYEWEFGDVNPPVQAWAVWRVYNMEKHANNERGDRAFLERCYHKLLMNFIWWVNRKDRGGQNIFEGGFLGLDNISVFDRSQQLPDGGRLEQADATGWMGLFCLNLMAIGLELAQEDRVYEHVGIKFFEHFMSISAAINEDQTDDVHMWDNHDHWYYDLIHEPAGGGRRRTLPLAVRSLVGLVPVFAAQVLEQRWFEKLPAFKARYEWLLTNRPELASGIVCVWTPDGNKCLLSIVNYDRLRCILTRALDENEFLSAFGLRSLSKYHEAHPFILAEGERQWTVRYEPAESRTQLFGGNSNWRGPVWFPTAFMFITALRVYDRFYGPGFEIECPTGSGRLMTLNQVAIELGRRLCSLFLADPQGHRPCYGEDVLHNAPCCRDLVLFHEYFHGDTGEGLGASHQTGWTGLVAKLLDQQATDRE